MHFGTVTNISEATHHLIWFSLMDMRKEQLKKLCAAQLLPVSGNKTQLTARIVEKYNTIETTIGLNPVTGATSVRVVAECRS